MNHKRGGPKTTRSGCLLCKPNKHQRANDERSLGHRGFGKLRTLAGAKADLAVYMKTPA